MLNNNLVLDGQLIDNEAIMTLVIALRTDEGIVLASDSRTTNTDDGRIYEDTQKLFSASDCVAIGISGSGQFTQPVIDRVRHKATSKAEIAQIGDILREEAVKEHKRQCVLLREGARISAEFLLAGWVIPPNRTKKEPFIYLSGTATGFALTKCDYTPTAALGNTAYCEVLLRRLFNSRGTIEDAQKLATLAILETARVVNNVNDRIQMLVVREREVEKISSERIDELKAIAQRVNWNSLLP
jgi:20S proteasome alpha/beta subunit